jgi:hypothetical protein
MPAATSATSISPHWPSSALRYARRRSPDEPRWFGCSTAYPCCTSHCTRGFQSASAWPVGPPCTCTTERQRRRDASAGARAAVHGRAPRLPHDRPRFDEPGRLEPADRTARDRARAEPFGREHDDLRRRHRARTHAHDAAVAPARSRCHPRDSSRADLRPGAPITSRPKPDSLRHHASSSPVGRPRERTLPGDHAGSAHSCSVRRAARLPSPSTMATRRRASTRDARRRARSAAGSTRPRDRPVRLLVADARRTAHDPRRVPRHVRQVPLLPRRARRRRATTRDPTRSRRARPAGASRPVEGHVATSHASSRSIAHATSPRAETAGASAARRGSAPARSLRSRARRQAAVGPCDHEEFVVGPGVPPAADPALGGDHHRRPETAVGGRDHHVGPAVEACRSRPGAPGGRPAGSAHAP